MLRPSRLPLLLGVLLLVACQGNAPPPTPTSIAPAPASTPTALTPSTLQPTQVPTSPAPNPTATAPAVQPAGPTATPPLSNPRPGKLGIHLLLEDLKKHWQQSLWPDHLKYARDLVGDWGFVVALVRLDDLDPDKWQFFFDQCRRLHLTPIIRFATFYDNEHKWWAAPIRDNEKPGGYFTVAEQYRDFLDHLTWPTPLHYVIIGNEPNRGDEWENQPNGEAYAHFLGDVATRLHDNDPKIVVLNGALDLYAPNTNGQPFSDGYRYVDADTFMDQMAGWDKDIFKKIQIWNSHAYPTGPFRDPPDRQQMLFDYINGAHSNRTAPWPAGLFNRGVNSYAWELNKVQELGGPPLPVLITETGWRHRESTSPDALDAGQADDSAQQVADYLEMAFVGNTHFSQYARSGWTPWLSDPRVLAVIPFALDGYPGDWGHSNWLVLDENGSVQGVYPQYTRMVQLKINH